MSTHLQCLALGLNGSSLAFETSISAHMQDKHSDVTHKSTGSLMPLVMCA